MLSVDERVDKLPLETVMSSMLKSFEISLKVKTIVAELSPVIVPAPCCVSIDTVGEILSIVKLIELLPE